ncbi:hypothetical protein GCM10023162_27570 [Klenkia terrae]
MASRASGAGPVTVPIIPLGTSGDREVPSPLSVALGATTVGGVSDPAHQEAPVPEQTQAAETTAPATEEVLVEDSLVEEVSIDGMCGVY